MAIEPDELARRCAQALYARDIAAQQLGIACEEVREGYAVLSMTVGQRMLNGHDICHGGYLFALADTAFAYACNSRNQVHVALGSSVEYLRPAQFGERLLATAEERAAGGRTGVYDVTVRSADGEVKCLFRGRSYRIQGDVIQHPPASR